MPYETENAIINQKHTRKGIEMKATPQADNRICGWTAIWRKEHKRRPKVSELPSEMQSTLGKKVFEYYDYRDQHRKSLSDTVIYFACLHDHGVDRDRPDGIDAANISRTEWRLGRRIWPT